MKDYMKNMGKAILTLAVLSTAFGTAIAQSTKPAVASRDLVRECMDAEDQLLARKQKAETDARANEVSLAEARAVNSLLNELQSQLNTSDAAAVNAFNKKRTAQNEVAAAINSRIDAHAKEVAAYNADSKAYNQKCAGVKMRIHDRRKINKERADKATNEASAESAP
jgi:peptidoglycan hydrolase CwlO-like protein